MAIGDVVWTQFQGQWTRVVIDHIFPDGITVVRALFPGDVLFFQGHEPPRVFSIPTANLQVDEPSFDQLDATYDDGDDACCA